MIICRFCGLQFNKVPSIFKHIQSHNIRIDLLSEFHCFHRSCNGVFSSYRNLRSHLYTHIDKNDKSAVELKVSVSVALVSNTNCNFEFQDNNDCNNLESNYTDAEQNSNSSCGNEILILEENLSYDSDSSVNSDSSFDCDNYCNNKKILGRKKDANITPSHCKSQLTDFIAEELSDVYCDPLCTKKDIQTICTFTENIASCEILKNVRERIVEIVRLTNDVTREKDLIEISDLLEIIKDPLSDINTEHKRNLYYKSVGALVPFKSFVMGPGRGPNAQGLEEPRFSTGMYFKIEDILEKLFKLPNVYDTIINYMEKVKIDCANIDAYISYVNGASWQRKLRNFEGKTVIPLSLFLDDFEPNNSLGSHSTLYKMCGVYFSIPALPLELITKLTNNFVTSFHFTDDRKAHGVASALSPVIASLDRLYNEGLNVNINGTIKTIYFCLAYIHSDNLGLNETLGFVDGFNANYYCRFCTAHKDEMHILCNEIPRYLRNVDNYNRDLITNDQAKTGIKHNSTLNNARIDFHVTDIYVGDCLHDMLEGVCKYNTSYILLDFMENQKLFSLQTLNYRVEYFNYGPNDKKNKPTLFTIEKLKERTVKMSGSEMHTFVRYAPLIFGDLVPQNSKPWQLFLYMREILLFITSPKIARDSIDYLKHLIANHNSLFSKLYGNLRPKYHFLTHYPTIIKESGPPVYYWTMRQEAKHKISKQYCKVNSNRKNMLLSLSWKHQMQFCNRILRNEGFENINPIIIPKKRFNLDANETRHVETSVERNIENYVRVEKIKICSFIYMKDSVIITNYDDEGYPEYYAILKILVNIKELSDIIFVCNKLSVEYLHPHFQSHMVKRIKDEVIVSFCDVIVNYPMKLSIAGESEQFVVNRYYF